jgi:hypothetical protein
MVTFNSPINFEVAATSINAAQIDGVALTVDAAGKVALAAAGAAPSAIDAILISEIVDSATFKDRYYIYNDIDFGPYVQVGELVSVAKGFHGMTCSGLKLASASAALSAGDELEIGVNGVFQKKNTGVAVGRCLEAVPANSVRLGAVHFYNA